MSKATITIEAFVANELNIREVTGHRVVDVSLPHTASRKNAQGEWEDSGPTTWYQATFWDEHADAVLRTVDKSTLVTVSGFPELETYQKNDGTPGGKVLIKSPTLAVVVRKPKGTPPAQPPSNVWAASGPINDDTPF